MIETDLWQQYIKSGRPEFKVKGIDMYRDGGTIHVDFDNKEVFNGTIFSNKKDRSWYSTYSCSPDSKIEDALFIAYLSFQITRYENKMLRDYESVRSYCKQFKYDQ